MIRPRIAALSLTCATLLSVCFSDSSAHVSVRVQRMNEQDAASHIEAARKYLKRGSYTQALQEAEEALVVAPDSALALSLKSEALLGIYAEGYRTFTDEARAARRRQIKQTAEDMEKYPVSKLKADDANEWREQLTIMRGYIKYWQSTEAKAAGASESEVLKGKEVATKPRILSKPKPEYTGVSGVVVLQAILSAEGRVENILVIQGLTPMTTREAIKAARRIKFQPATKGGRPVSMYYRIEYHFIG